MSLSDRLGEVPSTRIPGNDEHILHGVSAQFMPTIAKCSLGGWIVVIQGKGISAWTSLEEAIAFVGSEARSLMGDDAEDELPNVLRFDEKAEERRRGGPSIGGLVASVIAALALAVSVKIA